MAFEVDRGRFSMFKHWVYNRLDSTKVRIYSIASCDCCKTLGCSRVIIMTAGGKEEAEMNKAGLVKTESFTPIVVEQVGPALPFLCNDCAWKWRMGVIVMDPFTHEIVTAEEIK